MKKNIPLLKILDEFYSEWDDMEWSHHSVILRIHKGERKESKNSHVYLESMDKDLCLIVWAK